jgi:hypothetical protein
MLTYVLLHTCQHNAVGPVVLLGSKHAVPLRVDGNDLVFVRISIYLRMMILHAYIFATVN